MTRSGHSIDSAHKRTGLPAIVELKLAEGGFGHALDAMEAFNGSVRQRRNDQELSLRVADRADADAFAQRFRGGLR